MTTPARRITTPLDDALTRAVQAVTRNPEEPPPFLTTIGQRTYDHGTPGRDRTRDVAPTRRQNGLRAAKPGRHAGTPPAVEAAVAERRRKAFDLWIAGVDYVTIGRTLQRQNKPNGEPGTPHGYDGELDDRRLAGVVRTDVYRARDDRAADHIMNVREWREYLTAIHLRHLAALQPAVLRGNARAVEVATKVGERIAKLQGADKPLKVEVTSQDPVVIEAVSTILGLLDGTDVVRTAHPVIDADPKAIE